MNAITKQIARLLPTLSLRGGLGVGLAFFALSLFAQSPYDPGDPPEPWTKYKVTVSAANPSACNVSGTGQYTTGTSVTISSSARTEYTFSHWTKNGERIDQPARFTYTVESESVTFVAHYTYSPGDPEEPSMVLQSRLYLTSSSPDAVSFNRTSGAKANCGETVYVRAYVSQGYKFLGWYEGETLLSTSQAFNYLMPTERVTLTARVRYDPDDPDDPSSPGGDIQNFITGDVNSDNKVTIADVTALVNIILGKDDTEPYQYNHDASDVNKDGKVTIADVTALVNIILGK